MWFMWDTIQFLSANPRPNHIFFFFFRITASILAFCSIFRAYTGFCCCQKSLRASYIEQY